jgi:hypothetical protein
MSQSREIEEHKKIYMYKIKYKMVTCKECHTEVIHHELQCHQDNDCPNALIPCPNECNEALTKTATR